jgi:hypothetical protein
MSGMSGMSQGNNGNTTSGAKTLSVFPSPHPVICFICPEMQF